MKDLISTAVENSFVADTQISRGNRQKSYFELLPKLGIKKNIIFASIYLGYDSPYEVEEVCGLPIRTVAARITEMKNEGYIVEAGTKKGKFGKDNSFYKIASRYLPTNVDKTNVKEAIDDYKRFEANTKTYTPDEIRVVLNQVRLKSEMIDDIIILMKQFN